MIKSNMGRLAAALFLLIGGGASAQEKFRLETYEGYQREDLHWSIAGNSAGQSPNIYSELKWKNRTGLSTGGYFSWEALRRWTVFVEGWHMSVLSGSVTDTDYGADNRTDPIYKEKFDAKDGYGYSFSTGVGYRVLERKKIKLTSFIGYGWSGQQLSITDPSGVYTDLDSRYTTHWKGGVLKGEVDYRPDRHWVLSAKLSYHQVSYHADADWNLIAAFQHPVSFRHHANGYGVEGEGRISYWFIRRIGLFLSGSYFGWRTGTGVDELYEADGTKPQTQLNGVWLDGYNIRLGVGIRF